MVVAQLVKRLLPTPEIRGSNPVIGKIYIECLLSSVLIRRKLIKEAENGPLKTMTPYCSVHFVDKKGCNLALDLVTSHFGQ